MYGKDYYTSDREAPPAFLKRLKQFDHRLECAWNQKRGIFEIIRLKDSKVNREFPDAGIHDPYDVVLECAETMQTRILDAEGVECAMRIPKEPGDWVFRALADRDTWKVGIEESGKQFMQGIAEQDIRKDLARLAFHEAHKEEGYAALCKDRNVSRARVPIGVSGTRDWRKL